MCAYRYGHVSHVRGRKDEANYQAETRDGMERGSIAARRSLTVKSTLYETGGHPAVVFLLYGSGFRESADVHARLKHAILFSCR